jgi:predicted ArsR family transcriptional regulator
VSRVSAGDVAVLARLHVVSYELAAKELGVSLHRARDIVMDLEIEGLLALATPAEYEPGGRPGRRGKCTWPATFRWVDDDDAVSPIPRRS